MSQIERKNLEALCSALQGETTPVADWTKVLALANRTLVTPALASALRGRDGVPEDVREFLEHIATRVRMRNKALHVQLQDAADAMVRNGLKPILFKGACFLADPSITRTHRLFADIDILVAPSDGKATLFALSNAGFAPYPSSVSSADGMNLMRNSDAGGLDLHFRLRALPKAPGYDELMPYTTPAKLGNSEILILGPTAQAASLIAHDQIQERDYWRGLIDLRHQVDLKTIVERHGPLDSTILRRLFPTPGSRRALDTQLLTANRLFGTPLPKDWIPGRWARLQARRCDWQLDRSGTMPLLTAASLIADPYALASPVAVLPGWRLRARYLRRMFEPRKPTKV